MSIKVVFQSGETSATGRGLFQWDYGQILEIVSSDIGSEITEVHFACSGMTEAIVRPCSFSNGTGTVTIPDQCLEQSSEITAWVYRIEGTQGHTIGVISLPVTARTRPSVAREIPQDFSNRYTELITEINEAVDNLEQGNITAKNATQATNATYAVSAGNAASASYSSSSGRANKAGEISTSALFDVTANIDGEEIQNYKITIPGLYVVECGHLSGGGKVSGIISVSDLTQSTKGSFLTLNMPWDEDAYLSWQIHYDNINGIHVYDNDGSYVGICTVYRVAEYIPAD